VLMRAVVSAFGARADIAGTTVHERAELSVN
jgi:hypothetical protein